MVGSDGGEGGVSRVCDDVGQGQVSRQGCGMNSMGEGEVRKG